MLVWWPNSILDKPLIEGIDTSRVNPVDNSEYVLQAQLQDSQIKLMQYVYQPQGMGKCWNQFAIDAR